jgi:hypothetical protein
LSEPQDTFLSITEEILEILREMMGSNMSTDGWLHRKRVKITPNHKTTNEAT